MVRSIHIGTGIASGPVISISPEGVVRMYIVTSGGAGQGGAVILPSIPPLPSPSGKMLYWRDIRLQ
jgi:hypothetical protein